MSEKFVRKTVCDHCGKDGTYDPLDGFVHYVWQDAERCRNAEDAKLSEPLVAQLNSVSGEAAQHYVEQTRFNTAARMSVLPPLDVSKATGGDLTQYSSIPNYTFKPEDGFVYEKEDLPQVDWVTASDYRSLVALHAALLKRVAELEARNKSLLRNDWVARADKAEAKNAELEADRSALREALFGASHALRSYEFGNSSEELARSSADAIDSLLERIPAPVSEG